MRVVVEAGLAEDPVVFATNTLELVVPAGNPAAVTELADLADPDLRIALCDPRCRAERHPTPCSPRRASDAARDIRERGAFDIARDTKRSSCITQHDVIAFTTAVAEHVGPSARWLHFGLTSSDVIDTAQALQMREACNLLLKGLDGLMHAVRVRADEHRRTPMISLTVTTAVASGTVRPSPPPASGAADRR